MSCHPNIIDQEMIRRYNNWISWPHPAMRSSHGGWLHVRSMRGRWQESSLRDNDPTLNLWFISRPQGQRTTHVTTHVIMSIFPATPGSSDCYWRICGRWWRRSRCSPGLHSTPLSPGHSQWPHVGAHCHWWSPGCLCSPSRECQPCLTAFVWFR